MVMNEEVLDRTAQVVSVLQQTGQPPAQLIDTHTILQKALNLDDHKTIVRRLLKSRSRPNNG